MRAGSGRCTGSWSCRACASSSTSGPSGAGGCVCRSLGTGVNDVADTCTGRMHIPQLQNPRHVLVACSTMLAELQA